MIDSIQFNEFEEDHYDLDGIEIIFEDNDTCNLITDDFFIEIKSLKQFIPKEDVFIVMDIDDDFNDINDQLLIPKEKFEVIKKLLIDKGFEEK